MQQHTNLLVVRKMSVVSGRAYRKARGSASARRSLVAGRHGPELSAAPLTLRPQPDTGVGGESGESGDTAAALGQEARGGTARPVPHAAGSQGRGGGRDREYR